MSEYVNGEIVRIQIAEAEVIRTEIDDVDVNVVVQLEDGFRIEVPTTDDAVTIRRVRPAGGMPQPGDVWRDKYGAIYFAKGDTAGSPSVKFVSPNPSTALWEYVEQVNEQFGPIELLFRPPAPGGER